MMAEALKSQGLHWQSMAYFMEKSRDWAYTFGPVDWGDLFGVLGQVMRELADAADERFRAREKELERPDIADCRAGECDHDLRSETVSRWTTPAAWASATARHTRRKTVSFSFRFPVEEARCSSR